MSNKQYVDDFAAPLLAEFEKMKKRLVDELDVNEKMRDNLVKMEEQMKIEVEKNATLEAEKVTLTETLATKDEIIKVLTGASNRINNNREKDATIRQLRREIARLNKQREQASENTTPNSKAKRKQTASDETSPKRVTRVLRPRTSNNQSTEVEAAATLSSSVERSTIPGVATPTRAFNVRFLYNMQQQMGQERYSTPRKNFDKCDTAILSANELVATFLLRNSSWVCVGGKSVILDIVSWNLYIIANATDQNTRTAKPFPSLGSEIMASAKFQDGIITAHLDGTIRKWKDGNFVQSVRLIYDGPEVIMDIKVINDQIVVGLDNGIVILSAELKTVKRFDNTKNIIEITGNEKYIAGICDVISDDDEVSDHQVFFFPKNGESEPIVSKLQTITAISVSVSGHLLASASNNSYVHVWDMSAKKELYRLKHGNTEHIRHGIYVKFHKDWIITTSYDGSTRIWCSSSGEQHHSIENENISCQFDTSPDGGMIALPHENGISIWSLINFEKIFEFELADFVEVHFLTNEKIIAITKNGLVYLLTSSVQ